MDKQNLNLRKTELRQILVKSHKQGLNQNKVNKSGEKTIIKAVNLNELINWQQIEEVSSDDNAQLMLGNVPANQSGLHSVTGQIGVLSIDQLQPIDRSQMVVVNVTGQEYHSEESILEQKINSLGFDVSAIRSYLDKKVSFFSREEIFEMFEKIRPQLRSFVGQQLYSAGFEFNWNFIDDVLNRIISQWDYSNNGIGGENQKDDFKFTKVIDILSTIKSRINLAVIYGINGNEHTYESDEILEGSFCGSYKTLMYNLLYTDDRYLNEEEIELKTALLSLEQDNNNSAYCYDTLSLSEYDEEIEKFSELFKNYLKSKFNYTDCFISSILDFAKENIHPKCFGSSIIGSIKEYIKVFEENIFQLIQVPKMVRNYITLETGDESEIVFTYEETVYYEKQQTMFEYSQEHNGDYRDKIEAGTFYNFFLESNSNSEIQTKFISSLLKDIKERLNLFEFEMDAFMRIVFKRIADKFGIERNQYGNIVLSESDFYKLNSKEGNFDSSWIDEIYEIIQEEASKINPSVDPFPTEIDTDILFANYEIIDAEYIYEHLDEMLLSDDSGVRKFAQIISNKIFDFDKRMKGVNKKNFIKWLIVLMNEKCGIPNAKPNPTLNNTIITCESIQKWNSEGIFDNMRDIMDGDKFKYCFEVNIDGEIDAFSQGNEKDCWLLAGLIALNSSEGGREYIRNAIKWNDDYTKVLVNLNGTIIELTSEEILEFKESSDKHVGSKIDKRYSDGRYFDSDMDVLVLELAMIKHTGTIDGFPGAKWKLNFRNAGSLFTWFGDKKDRNTETCGGLDDILDGISGIWGNSGKVDLAVDTVKEFLQSILDNMQSGEYSYFAATFAFFQTGGSEDDPVIYSWRDMYDGRSGECSFKEATGHVLAITAITATTVTIVNPWNSTESWTMSWDTFANLKIAQLSVSYF